MQAQEACAHCRNPLESDARYCNACGKAAPEHPSPQTAAQVIPAHAVPSWPIDTSHPKAGLVKAAYVCGVLAFALPPVGFVGTYLGYRAREAGHPQGNRAMEFTFAVATMMITIGLILYNATA